MRRIVSFTLLGNEKGPHLQVDTGLPRSKRNMPRDWIRIVRILKTSARDQQHGSATSTSEAAERAVFVTKGNRVRNHARDTEIRLERDSVGSIWGQFGVTGIGTVGGRIVSTHGRNTRGDWTAVQYP